MNRIKEFGEVFTNEREIKDMINLINVSSNNLLISKNATILEPTCGNGNFIIEILKLRLKKYGDNNLEILKTIYAYDILENNIIETKNRILQLYNNKYHDKVLEILKKNIICKDFFEIKFKHYDIVIGNPPYQKMDNGFGSSATPIYNLFIEKIINNIKPKYFSFIIPSRWLTGGKGLEKFRKFMLNLKEIEIIVDFKNSNDCFNNVWIEGGVCYFLYNYLKNNNKIIYIEKDNEKILSKKERILNEFDIFIRDNKAISILKKVLQKNINSMSKNIRRSNFGFNTNFKNYSIQKTNLKNIKLYGNKRNMKNCNGQGYLIVA